jgi:GNAT superfamily N-acetyltransferase
VLLELRPVTASDREALVLIRIEAMQESLERIGRFDPARARERFESGFVPEHTRHIVLDGERVGFVAVKPQPDHLLLDHLYIRPTFQGRGVGRETLRRVFSEADAKGLPVKVGALRGSDSNRFYTANGFLPVSEGEWDLHYQRPVGNPEARI